MSIEYQFSSIYNQFSSIYKEKDSHYFFQITNGRKLSDICHSHDFYELVFLMKGTCETQINNETLTMKKGVFYVLAPGDTHFFASQSADANVFSLSVETSEFLKFSQAYGLSEEKSFNSPRPKIFSVFEDESVISQRLMMCTKGTYREHEYKLLLATLLKCVAEQTETTDLFLPSNLKRMIRGMQLQKNLQSGICAMSSLSSYSRTHLTRLMKLHMHTTPHEYLLHARMQFAYNLLLYSSQSAEEIGESVGYFSYSYFHRIFKDRFGLSPKELQRKSKIQTL